MPAYVVHCCVASDVGSVMGTLATGVSRRALIGSALALGLQRVDRAGARGVLYTHSEVTRGLQPPLTLGIARVVLQPGAVSQSTSSGMRMIAVESGVVAVGRPRNKHVPITAADLSPYPVPRYDLVELIMATGTSFSADDPGIISLRNPGSGAAVILDVVVYRDEMPALSREFTSDTINFQLLASAVAQAAPEGDVTVRLERKWLSPGAALTQEAGSGVTLGYVEQGDIRVTVEEGEVSTARAATAALDAVPGALQALEWGREQLVTAGGMVFVPQDGAATVSNGERRSAELLLLSVLPA
jgi:hypothetical protein